VEDFFRDFEERPALERLVVEGVELKKGSRVLLSPRPGGDIMDLALKEKVALIEGIEQDYEDRIYIAVTLEDDPGRDLGADRILGHRFFFSPEEVIPLDLETSDEF
jgi:hydrogenase maturation protease